MFPGYEYILVFILLMSTLAFGVSGNQRSVLDSTYKTSWFLFK